MLQPLTLKALAARCAGSAVSAAGSRLRCFRPRHCWDRCLSDGLLRGAAVHDPPGDSATSKDEARLLHLELVALLLRLPPPLDSLPGARLGGPVDPLPALLPRLPDRCCPRSGLAAELP